MLSTTLSSCTINRQQRWGGGMGVLTVRGIEGELESRLRAEAARRGMSLNALVIELVARGLGVTREGRRPHHDLDHLAGTWAADDTAEFTKATAPFERIDEELWP
jgi:plasmid stability protein